MNILLINKFHFLKGGSERHVFELSELLEKKGHKVFHFSMQDEKNKADENEEYFVKAVDLHKFSLKNIFKYFYNFEAKNKLEKFLKANKIDLAHLHNIDGQISPSILRVLKKKNIPIVQTLHDYKLICPNAKLYAKNKICLACKNGKYYNCILKKCVHDSFLKSVLAAFESYFNKSFFKRQNLIDVFIAPSKFMKEICVSFGIDEKKMVVINNFLNDEYFHKADEAVKAEDYLLYFGRLESEKGVEVLLQSYKELREKQPLKIVGDGRMREALEKMAEGEEKIEFLGYKEQAELEDIIKKAKAIIIPSLWYENMPYNLIESLSLSKVVIAARTGGMSEMIDDKVSGFLFKRGDVKDLAQTIDSLDNFDLKEVEKEAKKKALDYNSENFYKKLMEVYFNVLRVD
jgi:glycosyltransferase involved in cell wall biosynthesis